MNLLAQSAFLQALGWALLHSLWQMGILWLLYLLLTVDGKKFRSRQRYNLALVLAGIGSISLLVTFLLQLNQKIEIKPVYQPADSIAFALPELSLFSKIAQLFEPALQLLSITYIVTIVLLFVRFYRQYYFSQALITSGLEKVNPELRLFLEKMTQRFTIKKNIQIRLSSLVTTPLTVGFWKPIILLPIAAINQLSTHQTEAIILHELNHIRQNDYLINLLIACLDILLFFNPFSRLLTGILMRERENCCDDIVLQFRYIPKDYAKALLILEQHRMEGIPLLAVSATGNSKKILLHRVQRIVEGKNNYSSINPRIVTFFIGTLLIGFIGLMNRRIINIEQPLILSQYNPIQKYRESFPVFSTLPAKEKIEKSIVNKASAISPMAKENTQSLLLREKEKAAEQLSIVSKRLKAYAENNTDEFETTIAGYVSGNMKNEFSIQENKSNNPLIESVVEAEPYVPSNSFSYQYIEDTSFPKTYVPTLSELKAKENLEIALKALEKVDWKVLQTDIAGKNKQVDIMKLQEELKKALSTLDWKKIDEEVAFGLSQTDQELKKQQGYLALLQKFQKSHNIKKQTNDQKRELILMDRILQNKAFEKKQVENKNILTSRIKKIVVI